MLRLAFVTGTEPGKWFARYRDTTDHGLEAVPSDDPYASLIDDTAHLALLRLPDPRIGEPGEQFHQVRLYTEKPGVAVPKDSVYAEVGEAVRPSDLADEHVNYRFVPGSGSGAGVGTSEGADAATDSASAHVAPFGSDIDELRAALQVVAANVGVAYAPAPLLKVLSKKQVVVLGLRGTGGGAAGAVEESQEAAGAVEVEEAQGAETEIALVWKVEKDSEAIQDFVGVAKGRTRNSSRGRGTSKSGRSRSKSNRYNKSETGALRKGFSGNRPKRGGRRRRR